jgi:hypothetical protein
MNRFGWQICDQNRNRIARPRRQSGVIAAHHRYGNAAALLKNERSQLIELVDRLEADEEKRCDQ